MNYRETGNRFVTAWLLVTLSLPTAPLASAEDTGVPPKPQRVNWSAQGFTDAQKKFWSFQPVKKYDPPPVNNKAWVRTPVDSFILAKLEGQGIAPAPEADRETLIRRVTIDVTGLPPTPEEVDAFAQDKSPQAYEHLVDRLLASQAFGEHWARHWLDIARYGDTDGYIQDDRRPNSWRYRDYIIQAFNNDKPYDRFIREQIAGDEIWPNDPDAFIATGYLRGYQDEFNARDIGLRRQEILNDITDVTGSSLLGLTYGCARCHDHKFDAIRHEDYYQLQSFFANTVPVDDHPLLTGAELSAWKQKKAAYDKATEPVRSEIEAIVAPLRKKAYDQRLTGFVPADRVAITKAESERTPVEKWIYARYKWRETGFQRAAVARLQGRDIGDTAILDTDADQAAAKKKLEEDRAKYAALNEELKKFKDLDPGPMPVGWGMTEQTNVAPATYILRGGTYEAKVREVQPGFLGVLGLPAPKFEPNEHTTGRRTALANWIADPSNPLTARVIVNRLWAGHFGRGIVGTPSDFGVMGDRPTHPELLDYLATSLVKNGWSLKSIHRMILLSNTYRQASNPLPESKEKDPRNQLISSFPWHRLEAEEVRDAALFSAGLLVTGKVGGQAFQPPLPKGMEKGGGRARQAASTDPNDYNRRSVYIAVRRNQPDPMLEVFDAPPSFDPCPQRSVSTTAPQALTLFNSEQTLEWSEALAGRVIREAGNDVNNRIDRLYRILYARAPDGWEKDSSQSYLFRQREIIGKRAGGGDKLALPTGVAEIADKASAAAFVDLCHALLNSNEFVYRF
jgi:hypothetical protein